MRIDVEHLTTYSYSDPVTLAPQTVRLRPRPDGSFRELSYRLLVDPAPALRTEMLDAAGNLVTRLWFEGETRELRIVSRFTVQTLIPAAYGLLVDSAQRRLPVSYPSQEQALLTPYLGDGRTHPAVAALVEGLAARSQDNPLDFLILLTDWLYRGITREIREQGEPQTPAETLERGRGACRDQTMLFVAAARAMGIAARFVSGYQDRSAMDTPERHLHAWPECYIPGCGWRGFDPTRGIPVTNRHVPVAAAPVQAGAMPVEGSYFGAATSRLGYDVRIRTDDA